ncbi:MAG TPA: carboxypeptidase-like regulatory domain-containing protein [Ignavibacteriaceae bacterium]
MNSNNLYIILVLIFLGFSGISFSQEKEFTITGFIYDSVTGENLIGTNILVYKDSIDLNSNPAFGSAANNYGYYVLPRLKKARYFLIYRHIGYKTAIKEIDASNPETNTNLNVQLEPEDIRLGEIIVEGKKTDRSTVSTIDVNSEFLSKLPSFSGEVDLFRLIQLLPGINKSSELSNGLYVRGGSPDQTLTLVDGSIVYNPSHIGNIASTFNSNAIRDVKLIKGAFPAEYGGRLSSVLDVKLRSGTKEKETGTIGLGFINSFFSLEGPLKSSSTFMVAGRWMYYDAWQKTFNKGSSVPQYRFFDINGKVNYILSETSAFSISGMYSSDKMYNPAADDILYDIEWKNINLSLNWIQINTGSVFLNSTLNYINYNFSSKIGIGGNSVSSSSYYSNPDLKDITIKQTAEIKWDINQIFKTGFEISFHNYDLLYNEYYDAGFDTDPYAGQNINSIENAFYFQNESEFFSGLKTNIGGRIFYFGENKYLNFEPRFSLSYQILDNIYLKGAAALANQYLHLISKNDITLPTDLWYPSTKKIKPSKSVQYVFGMDSYFEDEIYQASIEGYYRDMKNLYEYKNSPKINALDNSIEDQFTAGTGEAYGVELFVQKRKGNFKGWIGYTLSWTKRKFSELNAGKIFYPKYDRRNDLSVAASYDVMDNLSLSLTFTYATGLRYTLPPGQYIFNPIGVSGNDEILLDYGEINASKFPPYHRLDLGANYNIKLNKADINIFVNLYNLYNRKNAFAQYVVYNEDNEGNKIAQLKRISLFPFIPAAGVSITF